MTHNLYIPYYDGLNDHPKTRALRRLLGLQKRREAASIMLALWSYTAEHSLSGNLAEMDLGDVAEVCEWDGEPMSLIDAMVAAGFVDEGPEMHLHDIETHQQERIALNADSAIRRKLASEGKGPKTGHEAIHRDDGMKERVEKRDGLHCRFCWTPVVRGGRGKNAMTYEPVDHNIRSHDAANWVVCCASCSEAFRNGDDLELRDSYKNREQTRDKTPKTTTSPKVTQKVTQKVTPRVTNRREEKRTLSTPTTRAPEPTQREARRVAEILGYKDQAINADILRIIEIRPEVDPIAVADNYMRWQYSLPEQDRNRHVDRIAGFSRQMKRAEEQGDHPRRNLKVIKPGGLTLPQTDSVVWDRVLAILKAQNEDSITMASLEGKTSVFERIYLSVVPEEQGQVVRLVSPSEDDMKRLMQDSDLIETAFEIAGFGNYSVEYLYADAAGYEAV